MTADQIQVLVVAIGGIFGAIERHKHVRNKQIGVMKDNAQENQIQRVQLEEARQAFMSEKVTILVAESCRLRTELEDVKKAMEQYRTEMHSLSGRVEAMNETYKNVLTSLKAAREKQADSGEQDANLGRTIWKKEP